MQDKYDGLRAYQFGEFMLHLAERELWRDGEQVQTSARVFDCLVALIEHCDRAVDRDELIARIWGKTDVADNLLAQLISRTRSLIGDAGDEQRMIRTVAGFGYRWVSPVQAIRFDAAKDVASAPLTSQSSTMQSPTAAGVESGPGQTDPGNGDRNLASTIEQSRESHSSVAKLPARLSSPWVWTLIFLGLSMFAVAAWLAAPPARVLIAGNTVLVLPVAVDDSEGAQWMQLGLMSLMAERLQMAGLPVEPNDNVLALTRGMSIPPMKDELDALGRSAGGALVLSASAHQSHDNWRVSLNTIRGRDPPLRVEGESPDALDAGALAADRMAVLLGYAPQPVSGTSAEQRAMDKLVRKTDALITAGQYAMAKQFLDGLAAKQRNMPELRFQRGRADANLGQFADARKSFEDLLGDLPDEQDPVLRARTLSALGTVRFNLKLFTPLRGDEAGAHRFDGETRAIFDEAIHLLEGQNDLRALGRALLGRGLTGSPAEALSDFGRARTVLEVVDDRLGVAMATARLGIFNARRDHFSQALPDLENAAVRLEDFRVTDYKVLVWGNMAMIHLAELDLPGAIKAEARLAELVKQTENSGLRDSTNLLRARILLKAGRMRETEDLWRPVYAATLAGQFPDPYFAHAMAAAWAWTNDDFATAEIEAMAARDARIPGALSTREELDAWMILVRSRIQLSRLDDAAAALTEMQAWSVADGSPAARGCLALATAEYRAARDDDIAAEAAYKEAMALFDSGTVPLYLTSVAVSHANWLIRAGRLQQAGDIAGRLANWAGKDYDVALLQLRLYHALGQVPVWKAALDDARSLAGERVIPAALLMRPSPRS